MMMWLDFEGKDLVQFVGCTGVVRRSLGAYQWHPSAEFAGWGGPAHKGRRWEKHQCMKLLQAIETCFFLTKSTVVVLWLIDQYPFFFPQVAGKFRAELQKEELKNSYVFLLGGRLTKACGNIQIHRENVRNGGHEGLVLETRSTNQGKISTKSLGCSFYKQWWLDGCSSCGCLAFGALFRGGDYFGSKKRMTVDG